MKHGRGAAGQINATFAAHAAAQRRHEGFEFGFVGFSAHVNKMLPSEAARGSSPVK
jgi:hypothetical protein